MSWIRFDYLDNKGNTVDSETVSVRLTKSATSLIADCGTQWRFRATRWRGFAAGLQPWGRSPKQRKQRYSGVTIRATPTGESTTDEAPWTVKRFTPNVITSVSVTLEPSLNEKIWEIMGPECGHEAVRQEAQRRQGRRDEWARESALAFNDIHQRCTWKIVEVTSHSEYLMMMELQWEKLQELRSAQREAERRWPTDLNQVCIGDAGEIGEFLLGVEDNDDLNSDQENQNG